MKYAVLDKQVHFIIVNAASCPRFSPDRPDNLQPNLRKESCPARHVCNVLPDGPEANPLSEIFTDIRSFRSRRNNMVGERLV